jgi:S1-C subfamily serine protease
VRPDDVVVRVGDTTVANTGELLAAVAALPPRSASTLTVQRGSELLELPVVVAERPRVVRQEER